jgi:hypothetical protein
VPAGHVPGGNHPAAAAEREALAVADDPVGQVQPAAFQPLGLRRGTDGHHDDVAVHHLPVLEEDAVGLLVPAQTEHPLAEQ